MSSSTHVKLDVVISFNEKVKTFSTNIDQCFETINRSMEQLRRDGWDDEMYVKFKEGFTKHSNELKPLSDALKKYNHYVDNTLAPRIKKILDGGNQMP